MKLKESAFFVLFILFFSAGLCHAGIKFGDADINEKDEVLYTVRHELPGTISYR